MSSMRCIDPLHSLFAAIAICANFAGSNVRIIKRKALARLPLKVQALAFFSLAIQAGTDDSVGLTLTGGGNCLAVKVDDLRFD